ncbi:MAG: hypothetical protein IH600_09075 [Bacteroidetes bacterium]|nr:hypothetical protein [Bacteroidota bacterium]
MHAKRKRSPERDAMIHQRCTALKRNASRLLRGAVFLLLLPLPLLGQYTQIFDPGMPKIKKMRMFDDTLYGCAGSIYGNSDPLVFSIDEGNTWRPYRSPISWMGAEITDIAVQDTLMYVLSDRGLFRKSIRERAFQWVTRVGGTQVIPDGANVHILAESSDTTIFYHSSLFGRDPQPYAHPLKSPKLLLAEDSTIWIFYYHELHYSSNFGASWKLRLSYPDNPISSLVHYGDAWYGVPMNGVKFLWRSETGYTWQPFPLPFYVGEGVQIEERDGQLCVWSEGLGVQWYDAASGTWTQSAPPLPGMAGYCKINGVQHATVSGSLYRCDEARKQWRLVLPRYLCDWRDMYPVATEHSLIISSSDAPAVAWRFDETGWWNVPIARRQYLSNIIDVDGTLYDSYDTTMWRSTDDGLTWPRFRSLPFKTGRMYADGKRLVALTAHRPPDTAYVVHSDDLGSSWVREAGFIDDQGTRSFMARDARRIVVTRENGPIDHWHYSPDAGGSWLDLNSTMQSPIEHVVFGESKLFARTSDGLSVSDDDGQSWSALPIPAEEFQLLFSVPRHVCLALPEGFLFIREDDLTMRLISYPALAPGWDVITANSRWIFFGYRHTGELWMLDYEDAVLSVASGFGASGFGASAAGSCVIEGISPFPLHGTGLVHIELRASSILTLQLSDALGRALWSRTYSVLHPGRHSLPINRVSLPCGLYFLRIVSGDKTSIRPLLIQ